jgi:hypothetical protein
MHRRHFARVICAAALVAVAILAVPQYTQASTTSDAYVSAYISQAYSALSQALGSLKTTLVSLLPQAQQTNAPLTITSTSPSLTAAVADPTNQALKNEIENDLRTYVTEQSDALVHSFSAPVSNAAAVDLSHIAGSTITNSSFSGSTLTLTGDITAANANLSGNLTVAGNLTVSGSCSGCGTGGSGGFATTSNDYWLSQRNTSNLAEGSNLYWTPSRFASSLAGTTTDALREGSSNLYFTNARVDSRFVTDLAATSSVNSITTLNNLASFGTSNATTSSTGRLSVANMAVTGLASGSCVQVGAGGFLTATGSSCGSGSGSINAIGPTGQTQTGPTITVASSSETNLGITITGSSNTLTFAPNWIGTLAANRGGTGITSPTAAGILLGSYAGGSWQQVATSSLGLLTTNVAEGSNVYFTNARADARINATSSIGTITSLPNLAAVGTITSGTWNGSAVGTAYGGTGYSSFTAGDILYANSSTTLAKLPVGSNGQVLKVAGGQPAWGVDLTTGGGGNDGIFATSTGLIYPIDPSQTLVVGSSATSSSNSIFEVSGQQYISSKLGIATGSPVTNLSVNGSGYLTGGLGVGVLNTAAGTLQTSGNATIGGTLNGATISGGSLSASAVNGVVSANILTASGGNFGIPFYQFLSATTTDALAQGSTNLYFTNALADARFVTDLAATSSVNSITTLNNLSLPLSQTTGVLSVARGGTNSTGFSPNSIIVSNAAGDTLIATGTQLTVGSILATTTATSSFTGGIAANLLSITSTNASSTFANGINLINGCFAVSGTCLTAGGGGGSGTVNSGTAGQFAYYAANGTAVSGSSLLTVSGSNIGIGTTSPYATLSVNSTAGVAAFVVGSSTGTQFIVDKNGNIGIGVSPQNKFDIASANSLSAGTSYFDFNPTTGNGSILSINSNYGVPNNITFFKGGASTLTINAGIYSGDTPTLSTPSTSNLELLPGATHGVGIGTSTPTSKLSVWGSSTSGFFAVSSSTSGDIFQITSNGNVGIGTTSPALGPLVMGSGAYVTSGGVWTNASDRNLKENFATVSPDDILTKIDELPVTEWNYKSEDPSIKHIGPIAQDFYAIFGLGNNNTSISTIDPAGIALLGIQALSKKVDQLEASSSQTVTVSGNPIDTLAYAGSQITQGMAHFAEIVTDKITATLGIFDNVQVNKQLCVSDVCVTRDQFLKMVQSSGAVASSSADYNTLPEETAQQSTNSGQDGPQIASPSLTGGSTTSTPVVSDPAAITTSDVTILPATVTTSPAISSEEISAGQGSDSSTSSSPQ